MMRFFATFGAGHTYCGSYVEIFAEDKFVARACMIRNHGDEWSQELYTDAEFTAPGQYLERYRPRKLATVRQRIGDQRRDGSPVFIADRRD